MKYLVLILIILTSTFACNTERDKEKEERQVRIREVVDTIGFANSREKMDTVIARIERSYGKLIRSELNKNGITKETKFKTVICPHDDYTYANYLYPLVLRNIKAKTVILFGVAHKAKNFDLENKLVFDSFDQWESAYGKVKISSLRDDLLNKLNKNSYIIHDSMQIVEHSLEAIVPFLQHYNPKVEIVPVLVPCMSYEKINELADDLANAMNKIATERNLTWGKDYAIVISNDAVHYGDKDWGGSNFAFEGTDTAGYMKALEKEHEIIANCLTGHITNYKIKLFTEYTVQPNDYKEYKRTWCGRYSVPFGLTVSLNLSKLQNDSINGTLLAYSTSIANENPDFTDIGMGVTAIAEINHWVGYAAIAY